MICKYLILLVNSTRMSILMDYKNIIYFIKLRQKKRPKIFKS